MWSQFTLLFFVLAALISPSLQVPSSIPNCFVCPPQDLAGRPLHEHSNSNSELFCRYQSVPNDFFCKYFLDTGLEKQDHDGGLCPPVASVDCTRKRRGVFPRSPYPPSPAARSPKPNVMVVRSQLGAKKRSNAA